LWQAHRRDRTPAAGSCCRPSRAPSDRRASRTPRPPGAATGARDAPLALARTTGPHADVLGADRTESCRLAAVLSDAPQDACRIDDCKIAQAPEPVCRWLDLDTILYGQS